MNFVNRQVKEPLPNTPQHRSHLPQYFRIICRDRGVVVVGGQEPVVAVFLGECFDSGFAIDHGGDDFALFARFLGPDYDVIAIADCNIDHGVTDDLEKEEFALSDEGFREWEDFFDVLLGKDGATGGDSAY